MSQHKELMARHTAVLPSWMALNYDEPICLVDGQGRHVVDADGQRYLDFFGGILTTSIGYNVAELVDAIRSQAGRMVHTSTLYLIEQQIQLAEKIAELSGIEHAKVFFVNSGTEANESALLFATTLRRSSDVLAMRNSYHGRSFGAMGITANRSWSASSLSPISVHFVQSGYRYRSPYRELSDAEYVAICSEDLRDVLRTSVSGDVACFIAEPIQGVGGFVVPPEGYFRALKSVLDEVGIPFISDEVQTGWGRTGSSYWGIGHEHIVPAALTFAKGLANGLAIGGIVANEELVESLHANSISTFGGNPLATTAALATIDYIESHQLMENSAKAGGRLLSYLKDLSLKDESIGDVRGRGLMIGVEFVEPGTLNPDADRAKRVLEQTRSLGLLVGKGGMFNNVLRLAPPMSITTEEIDEGFAVLQAAIAATAPKLQR